jgi:acyl carrier protein
MTTTDIIETLRGFLVSNGHAQPGIQVGETDDLTAVVDMDSLDMLELMMQAEEEWNLIFEDGEWLDLEPPTLLAWAKLIELKLMAKAARA